MSDLISREDVINAVTDVYNAHLRDYGIRPHLSKLLKPIKDLPAVQPKKIYMVCQQCEYHKYPSYEKCRECGASMEEDNEADN